jgi:hypothetical protein
LLPQADGGIAGTTPAMAFVVSGTTWQMSPSPASPNPNGGSFTYSASVSGTTLTLNITCPAGTDSSLIVLYTATETQITLYQAFMGGDVTLSQPLTVSTYSKQ